MIEVELPDGTVLEVDTDDDTTAAGAARSYLQRTAAMPRGERFLQGVKDVSLGAEQLAHRLLPLFPQRAQQVDQRIGELEGQYRPPEGIDWMRMFGQTAATLPVGAIVPGGPVAASAASGALSGVLQPSAPDDSFWSDKASDAALGALTGGAVGAVGSLLGKVISPNVTQEAKALMREGVTPTPGQLFGGTPARVEAKAESIPVLGEFIKGSKRTAIEEMNRAALGRVAAPIGAKAPKGVGRDAMREVEAAVSDAFERTVPQLTLTVDDGFADDFATVVSDASSRLTGDAARKFHKHISAEVIGRIKGGAATGRDLQDMVSEVGRLASEYSRDASASDRQVGFALRAVREKIDDALLAQNPSAGPEFAAARLASQRLAMLRDASQRSASGVFSPSQLAGAVRKADPSKGKRLTASGKAEMQDLSDAAREVLGDAYPDSGTAGRSLLGQFLAGAGAMYDPSTAFMLSLGITPYLPGMRNVAAHALASRPAGAASARQALKQLNPFLGIAAERTRQP